MLILMTHLMDDLNDLIIPIDDSTQSFHNGYPSSKVLHSSVTHFTITSGARRSQRDRRSHHRSVMTLASDLECPTTLASEASGLLQYISPIDQKIQTFHIRNLDMCNDPLQSDHQSRLRAEQ
jgi:hypothetical protein